MISIVSTSFPFTTAPFRQPKSGFHYLILSSSLLNVRSFPSGPESDYGRYNTHSVDSHGSAHSAYMDATPTGLAEPYPAWSADRQIPMSMEEIEDIFLDLTQKFGFQRDSMRNMVILFFILYSKNHHQGFISLISQCNSSTLVPHVCRPTKLYSPSMPITLAVNMPITVNGISPLSLTLTTQLDNLRMPRP
jgi:hypothetical protein